MDSIEKQAYAQIPRGYARVLSGEILPDDLLWSVSGEFLRRDNPDWKSQVSDAADAICCIRKGTYTPAPDQTVRTYKIPMEKAAETSTAQVQNSLFG